MMKSELEFCIGQKRDYCAGGENVSIRKINS